MRRLLTAAGLTVVLLAVSAAFAAPSQAAAPSATERVSSTTNAIPLTPVAAKQSSPPANACPYYYLCLWKNSYYGGRTYHLYYCGFADLAYHWWYGSFYDWVSNDTSSLVNNQTTGTVSIFWDEEDGAASLQQHSYGYRDNLVIDGWNDKISYVLVC